MSFNYSSINHGFTILNMFGLSERVKKTICLMPFDEFSKHRLPVLSMLEFSKRVQETIVLISFDEFSKRWLAYYVCLSSASGLTRLSH